MATSSLFIVGLSIGSKLRVSSVGATERLPQVIKDADRMYTANPWVFFKNYFCIFQLVLDGGNVQLACAVPSTNRRRPQHPLPAVHQSGAFHRATSPLPQPAVASD